MYVWWQVSSALKHVHHSLGCNCWHDDDDDDDGDDDDDDDDGDGDDVDDEDDGDDDDEDDGDDVDDDDDGDDDVDDDDDGDDGDDDDDWLTHWKVIIIPRNIRALCVIINLQRNELPFWHRIGKSRPDWFIHWPHYPIQCTPSQWESVEFMAFEMKTE